MSPYPSKKKDKNEIKQFFIPSFLHRIPDYPFTPWFIAGLYLVVMAFLSFFFHTIGNYGVETDFYWKYLPSAQQIQHGKVPIDPVMGPIYPLVLAAFGFVIPDLFFAALLINVLSASATLFLTYKLLQSLFRSDLALVVTLMVSVNLAFVLFTYTVGTDMFFCFTLNVVAFQLLRTQQFHQRKIVLLGLSSALAYLTRYNGIFLFCAVLFSVVFMNVYSIPWKKRFLAATLFVAVFTLTILPWNLYTLQQKGDLFYNKNYTNIAYEMYAEGTMSWDEFWYGKHQIKIESFIDVFLYDPGRFTKKLMTNVGGHFLENVKNLTGWPLGILFIIGLISLFKTPPTRSQIAYYALNGFCFSVLLVVFYRTRFSLYLLPFFLTVAFQSFTFFLNRLTLFGKRITIVPTVVVILFFLSLLNAYGYNQNIISAGPKEILRVAEWFKVTIPEEDRGKRIMARKPHIAHYLNLDFSSIPMVESHSKLLAILYRRNIDYLYFSGIEAAYRPALKYLLYPGEEIPFLKPLFTLSYPPAVLYQVMQPSRKSEIQD